MLIVLQMRCSPLKWEFLKGDGEEKAWRDEKRKRQAGKVSRREGHGPPATTLTERNAVTETLPVSPIFCMVVVLVRFEPAHLAASKSIVLHHRKYALTAALLYLAPLYYYLYYVIHIYK